MLDFIFTMLIFCEIIFTLFCIKKLRCACVYVDEIHVKMLESAKIVLQINDEISKTLKKINKVVRILTNKKILLIRRIIMIGLDIIQLIVLIKSLDLSKGFKSINYSNLKKIALAKVTQQVIKKVLDFTSGLCSA